MLIISKAETPTIKKLILNFGFNEEMCLEKFAENLTIISEIINFFPLNILKWLFNLMASRVVNPTLVQEKNSLNDGDDCSMTEMKSLKFWFFKKPLYSVKNYRWIDNLLIPFKFVIW